MLLLRRNTDRAIIRVTGPHTKAANRLQRRVRHRNSIRTKGEGFGEICGRAQTACNHKRNIFMPVCIEVTACTRKRGDCRNRDVITEDNRCCARPAAASIEDNIINANL